MSFVTLGMPLPSATGRVLRKAHSAIAGHSARAAGMVKGAVSAAADEAPALTKAQFTAHAVMYQVASAMAAQVYDLSVKPGMASPEFRDAGVCLGNRERARSRMPRPGFARMSQSLDTKFLGAGSASHARSAGCRRPQRRAQAVQALTGHGSRFTTVIARPPAAGYAPALVYVTNAHAHLPTNGHRWLTCDRKECHSFRSDHSDHSFPTSVSKETFKCLRVL